MIFKSLFRHKSQLPVAFYVSIFVSYFFCLSMAAGQTKQLQKDNIDHAFLQLNHLKSTYRSQNKNELNDAEAIFASEEFGKVYRILQDAVVNPKLSAAQQLSLAMEINIFLPEKCPELYRKMLKFTKHKESKVVLIYLLSLLRSKTDIPSFQKYLNDPDVDIRIAAIDGLGIIRKPAFPLAYCFNDISKVISGFSYKEHSFISFWETCAIHRKKNTPLMSRHRISGEFATQELPVSLRSFIAKRMVESNFLREREAAARFLLSCEKENVDFRFAEWGVWIQEGKNLSINKTVVEKMPGFVHRIGDGYEDLQKRLKTVSIVDKPVIHLTSKAPLVVDIEVQLRNGRPWFVYPIPNDLSLKTKIKTARADGNGNYFTASEKEFRKTEPTTGTKFPASSYGYPFVSQSIRRYGSTSSGLGVFGYQVDSAGVHWHSLIVNPTKPSWMKLGQLTKNSNWWNELRKVESSWVSSRGESERFLYYDGPSLHPTPHAFALENETLTIKPNKHYIRNASYKKPDYTYGDHGAIRFPLVPGKIHHRPNFGFFVDVDERGKVKAKRVNYSDLGGIVDLNEITRSFIGNQVLEQFQRDLEIEGLTKSESDGLISVWKKQFFQKPGRRFVSFLQRSDYDTICPIGVRPAPKVSTRVGLILTEFE